MVSVYKGLETLMMSCCVSRVAHHSLNCERISGVAKFGVLTIRGRGLVPKIRRSLRCTSHDTLSTQAWLTIGSRLVLGAARSRLVAHDALSLIVAT